MSKRLSMRTWLCVADGLRFRRHARMDVATDQELDLLRFVWLCVRGKMKSTQEKGPLRCAWPVHARKTPFSYSLKITSEIVARNCGTKKVYKNQRETKMNTL